MNWARSRSFSGGELPKSRMRRPGGDVQSCIVAKIDHATNECWCIQVQSIVAIAKIEGFALGRDNTARIGNLIIGVKLYAFRIASSG